MTDLPTKINYVMSPLDDWTGFLQKSMEFLGCLYATVYKTVNE